MMKWKTGMIQSCRRSSRFTGDRAVERRHPTSGREAFWQARDPQQAIRRWRANCRLRPQDQSGRCAADLRVIDLLVARLDVDRDTKEFELELAVPSWLGHCLNYPLTGGP